MEQDNEFWRFSLAVYSSPGVAEECLALQNQHRININFVLFCAWLGGLRRIALATTELEEFRQAVGKWDRHAVQPLRAAQRAMKGLPLAHTIRNRVRTLELDAERIEQAVLFDLANQHWLGRGTASPGEALDANLNALLSRHHLSASGALPVLMATVLTICNGIPPDGLCR